MADNEKNLVAKHDLVRHWMTMAIHDLGSARKLAESPDAFLDTAIFHCQQAAEKSLKGYLVYHDIEFEKSHDILILVKMAADIHADFAQFVAIANTLTPYSVLHRYPGDDPYPDEAEFRSTLAKAQRIHDFVLGLLPPETRPDSNLPSK